MNRAFVLALLVACTVAACGKHGRSDTADEDFIQRRNGLSERLTRFWEIGAGLGEDDADRFDQPDGRTKRAHVLGDRALALDADVRDFAGGHVVPRLLPRCFAETTRAASALHEALVPRVAIARQRRDAGDPQPDRSAELNAAEATSEAALVAALCAFQAATVACQTEGARNSMLPRPIAPFAPRDLRCP